MFGFRKIVVGTLAAVVMMAFGSTPGTGWAQPRDEGRPRPSGAAPAGDVTITIPEEFLNSFLEAIFTRLKPPSFPLSAGSRPGTHSNASADPPGCPSVVVLEREINGTRTSVRFANGQIGVTLAFSGSYYNSLAGCVPFKGWADAVVELYFDRDRQALLGHASVKGIHLDGVPSLANGLVLNLVQSSLDKRINPVQILQVAQLGARVPVTAAGGALALRAREVRPEVVPGALLLHIDYEFAPAS